LRRAWQARQGQYDGNQVTDTLPYPGGQIINAAMACALYTDAGREHACVAWVVLWDLPA